jgi:cell shape-determining protein MreD
MVVLLLLTWLLTPVMSLSISLMVTIVAVHRLSVNRFLMVAFFAGLIEDIWLVHPPGRYSLMLIVLATIMFLIQWRFASRPVWLGVVMVLIGELLRQIWFEQGIQLPVVLLTGGLTLGLLIMSGFKHDDQAVYLKR